MRSTEARRFEDEQNNEGKPNLLNANDEAKELSVLDGIKTRKMEDNLPAKVEDKKPALMEDPMPKTVEPKKPSKWNQIGRNLCYPTAFVGLISSVALNRSVVRGCIYGLGFGIGYSIREFRSGFKGII